MSNRVSACNLADKPTGSAAGKNLNGVCAFEMRLHRGGVKVRRRRGRRLLMGAYFFFFAAAFLAGFFAAAFFVAAFFVAMRTPPPFGV